MAKRRKSEIEDRTLRLVRMAAEVCDAKRGEEIRLLDVRAICDYTDYLLIATGTSAQQIRGLCWAIEEKMEEEKACLLSRSDLSSTRWVVLDYGSFVIHLFDPPTRAYYQLEELWGDAIFLDWQGIG